MASSIVTVDQQATESKQALSTTKVVESVSSDYHDYSWHHLDAITGMPYPVYTRTIASNSDTLVPGYLLYAQTNQPAVGTYGSYLANMFARHKWTKITYGTRVTSNKSLAITLAMVFFPDALEEDITAMANDRRLLFAKNLTRKKVFSPTVDGYTEFDCAWTHNVPFITTDFAPRMLGTFGLIVWHQASTISSADVGNRFTFQVDQRVHEYKLSFPMLPETNAPDDDQDFGGELARQVTNGVAGEPADQDEQRVFTGTVPIMLRNSSPAKAMVLAPRSFFDTVTPVGPQPRLLTNAVQTGTEYYAFTSDEARVKVEWTESETTQEHVIDFIDNVMGQYEFGLRVQKYESTNLHALNITAVWRTTKQNVWARMAIEQPQAGADTGWRKISDEQVLDVDGYVARSFQFRSGDNGEPPLEERMIVVHVQLVVDGPSTFDVIRQHLADHPDYTHVALWTDRDLDESTRGLVDFFNHLKQGVTDVVEVVAQAADVVQHVISAVNSRDARDGAFKFVKDYYSFGRGSSNFIGNVLQIVKTGVELFELFARESDDWHVYILRPDMSSVASVIKSTAPPAKLLDRRVYRLGRQRIYVMK